MVRKYNSIAVATDNLRYCGSVELPRAKVNFFLPVKRTLNTRTPCLNDPLL